MATRLAARQTELAVRSAAGQFLPRVDTFYSYGASGESLGEHDDDSTVGAVITLNILDPGRLGRLAEARAQRAIARAELEALERNVDVETIAAYERVRAAQQRVVVARQAFEQSTEAMRIVRDRYGEGLTTITEQLRAQAALLRAEMNLAQARSDLQTGFANLLRATGRLEDVTAFE